MALVAATGFDHGVSNATSLTTGNTGVKMFDTATGSMSVSATAAFTGAYGLLCNSTAANAFIRWSSNTFGASKTVLVTSFAVRLASLPASDLDLMHITSAAGPSVFIRCMASTANLRASVGTSTVVNADGLVVEANRWYWIDVRFDVSTANFTIDWRVDYATQPQAVGNNGSASTISQMGIGWNTAQTGNVHYDDWVLSITSGDYPLGVHKVVLLKPDTGGTATEIGTANATARFVTNSTADTTFSSANILSAVSEVPPLIGSTATGLCQRTSGTGNAASLPMTTYTLGTNETIAALRAAIVGWSGSATANAIGLRAYNGTTEETFFAAADPNFDNSTTAAGWVCKLLTLANYDTQSELDALQLRLGYSTSISPLPGAHAMFVEVAVKVSATAVGVSDSDTISASESVSIAADVGVTDSGSVVATETPQIGATVDASDSGTVSAADTPTIAASVAGTDSGTVAGSEAIQVSLPISLSDSGTVSASESILIDAAVPVTDSDTVSVAEDISIGVPISVADSDTIAASESVTVSLPVNVSDSGTVSGADTAQITAPVSIADSGTVAASESTSIAVPVSVSDTDTVAASEAVTVSAPINVSESGTISGAESVTVAGAISIADSGAISGLESPAIQVTLAIADAGTLTGIGLVVVSSPVSVADAGVIAGSESITLSATVPMIDTAPLSSAEATIVSLTLNVTDAGTLSSVDIPTIIDLATQVGKDLGRAVLFYSTATVVFEGTKAIVDPAIMEVT